VCNFVRFFASFFRFFFFFLAFCAFSRLFFAIFSHFFPTFFPIYSRIERGFSFKCKACSSSPSGVVLLYFEHRPGLCNAAVGRKDRSIESIAQVFNSKIELFQKNFYPFPNKHLQTFIILNSPKFSYQMRKFL
jgi:hypothetical protein